MEAPKPVYRELLALVQDRDCFVLTTNVDHQFQMAGFDKKRLFYTQGDYGLWQCSPSLLPKDLGQRGDGAPDAGGAKGHAVPPELVPRCPVCGSPMTMNLRTDDTFVQDEGWYRRGGAASGLPPPPPGSAGAVPGAGVGGNTPGIIKYPFWKMTQENEKAVYACVNQAEAYVPETIRTRAICIRGDIGEVLRRLTTQPADGDPLSAPRFFRGRRAGFPWEAGPPAVFS